MSTAKGGRPKIEIRAVADISAFALVTVDDGDSVYYTARTLSKAKVSRSGVLMRLKTARRTA